MTTCRDIITQALRMAKVIPSGGDPSSDESEDGMTVLRSLYDQWLAGGMFGRLEDVYTESALDAEPGQRIVAGAATITIPDTINDGCVTRPPYDLSAIVVRTSTATEISVYEAPSGWVRLDALTLDSDAPFAARGVTGLSACLATAWADTFGADLPRSVLLNATTFKMGLSYKIGGDARPRTAEYF